VFSHIEKIDLIFIAVCDILRLVYACSIGEDIVCFIIPIPVASLAPSRTVTTLRFSIIPLLHVVALDRVVQKVSNCQVIFSLLHEIFTDFRNSFTDTLKGKMIVTGWAKKRGHSAFSRISRKTTMISLFQVFSSLVPPVPRTDYLVNESACF